MFIALVTGSWVRPNFAAAAPPEPAAWSAATVTPHPGPMHQHPVALSRVALTAERSSAPANKTNHKPFRSAWMTKERPLTWNRLSPQSVLMPAPLSLTPTGFTCAGTQPRAPAATAPDRDILTRICIARR
ncbi:hypothetical protein MYSE111917_08970 [Mycobacterium senriense]|uniref:hypothetical protein n=1 Tax=Mycobacterium senriense TaxID=2775496 RepID=UPI002022F723|nr:hypothetical protein [Mycobacterium senriense]